MKTKGGLWGKKFYIKIYFWTSYGFLCSKCIKRLLFFSYSDIFDAMSLVKHSAGETVILQGKVYLKRFDLCS